jgi:glucose/arabinose dehydrogenase/plastocyanin
MTISGAGGTTMPHHDHTATGTGTPTGSSSGDGDAAVANPSKALLYAGMGITGLGAASALASIPVHALGSTRAATPMLFAGLGAAAIGIGATALWRHQQDAVDAARAPGRLPGGGTATSDATIPATVTGVSGDLGDGVEDAAAPRAELRTIATGLGQLTHVTSAPGDPNGLWLVEKTGKLLHRDASGKVETRLDITDLVSSGGEQGLLSVAFHPRFAQNGRLFVDYTDKDGTTHVAEAHAGRGGKVERDSLKDLFTVNQPYANHNGGQLQFGPDGMLYVGMGDGGSGGDPQERAQDLGEKLGKILRVDVDHPDAGKAYGIPADNPYRDTPGAQPEIYATGVRNPWRFSFDSQTGDLWIGDVGQGQWEEVNYVPRGQAIGANFGWNAREGAAPYAGGTTDIAPGRMIDPALQYSHQEGASITGGYVYHGSDVPSLKGWYVYSDIAKDTLRAVKVQDGAVVGRAELPGGRPYTVSFGEGGDGEIYAVTLGGELAKVDRPGTGSVEGPGDDPGSGTGAVQEIGVQNGTMRFDRSEYHVKAGRTTLRLHNTDTSGMPHNVGVMGNGIAQKMSDMAFTGDTVELTVDLDPGEYTIFCAPHMGAGMVAKLVVDE